MVTDLIQLTVSIRKINSPYCE